LLTTGKDILIGISASAAAINAISLLFFNKYVSSPKEAQHAGEIERQDAFFRINRLFRGRLRDLRKLVVQDPQ
jgi:hypothetical protein